MKRILKSILTVVLLALFGLTLYYFEDVKDFVNSIYDDIVIKDKDDDYEVDYSNDQDQQGFYYYSLDESDKYYSSIKDKKEEELFPTLRNLMQKKQLISYGDARYALEESDRHLTKDGVWNIYDSSIGPSKWDSKSWHREHVWPNSRLGIPRVSNNQRNIGTDLHNLRAIVPSVNSSRSNFYYDEGSGTNKVIISGESYYPGDEHKGDVARIILYMALTYEELRLAEDDLKLNDGEAYTSAGAKMGKLSVLLKWHKEDPVDEFEIQRNNVIQKHQKNRNPFIDYPGLVHLIWEDKTYDDLKYPEVDVDEEGNIQTYYKYFNNNWRTYTYVN